MGRTAKGRLALNMKELLWRKETKAAECQWGGWRALVKQVLQSCRKLFSLQFGCSGPLHPVVGVVGSKGEFGGNGLVSQYQRTGELVLIQNRKCLSPSIAPSPGTRHAESSVYQP